MPLVIIPPDAMPRAIEIAASGANRSAPLICWALPKIAAGSSKPRTSISAPAATR